MVQKLNLETQLDTKDEKESIGFWSKVFKKNKAKKPNRVTVIYKRINGNAEPLYVEVKKGMFVIHDKTYHESELCRYNLKIGNDSFPFYSVNEKGLIPEGKKEYYDKIEKTDEIIQEHQDLAIKAIRHAELVRIEGEQNKGMNPKLVIVFVIVGIIAFALLKNYI